MFDLNNPETLWLNITNLGLGLVTLACCAAIGKAALEAVRERARRRAFEALEHDDHAFVVPGLGITMADGGESHPPDNREGLSRTTSDR